MKKLFTEIEYAEEKYISNVFSLLTFRYERLIRAFSIT